MLNHPDVVVVGAGAAGISAAHTLMSLGLRIAVVEAAERIGGRCWTDLEVFGVPYDVGAHWLHFGANNFFLPYGQQHGFDLYSDPEKYQLYQKNHRQPNAKSTIDRGNDRYWSAIQDAINKNRDVSVAEATEHLDRKELSEFIFGPWIMGKEVREFSIFEYSSTVEEENWFCRQGFGALVAHYGATLPVALNTQVTAINWSGHSVKVETNQGDIHTKAVILTVSTGVLTNDSIRFTPTLPVEKQEAFNAVSMGCYEHVVLQFAEEAFSLESDSYVISMPDGEQAGFGALVNLCETGLVFCDIGGQVARTLTPLGQEVCVDYAMSEMCQIFGNDIRRHIIKGTSSNWLTNPYTFGSYASAKPGMFHMRKELREPVGDRIFFAGEACHPLMWATVAGAHASGHEMATKIGALFNSLSLAR